jgi:Ca-activated chloride channel homolog
MKRILTVLAALLLFFFIACDHPTSGKEKTENLSRAITVTDSKAPASSQKGTAITITTIHQDGISQEEVMEPPKSEQGKGIIEKDGLSFNTEDYDAIVENKFLAATQEPLSTFSIDVDEASYSNIRRYIQNGGIPPAGAVRIEEMINYFDYDYSQPVADDPFAVYTEISDCPWSPQHKLIHIGLQGKEIPVNDLPASNMVFLVDVSGSMNEPNKLPLVQASLNMLTDQLREKDRVAIVVYAGNAGLVLPSTNGTNKIKIKAAIDNLEAGGSTAGGAGIQLAYKIAKENFIKGGNNRIILATDGDFNVGASSDDELVRMIEQERKSGVYLSVLGYGMGNYKDNKMQQLADKGNGNHSYIDNINEARKVLVSEFGSTLFTIAKDVKIQVEFNPARVQSYRLVGYENRMLAAEDFNDDAKDAGELGSGHTVTALYEIIPVGVKDDFSKLVDPLKYQSNDKKIISNNTNEIMTIKLRYKKPDEDISKLITHAVIDDHIPVERTSNNFRFSAAVAEFGLLLRNSAYQQQASYSQVTGLAKAAKGTDNNGYRAEFIQLVQTATSLAKN